MKIIIVGLGVQGNKRKKILNKKDYVASVDPINSKANYKFLSQVPLKDYDSCFLCVPDKEKRKLIDYCIKNKKHILVEKPLLFKNIKEINDIEKKANKNNVLIYTAYNHRFEPSFVRMKKLINSGKLGRIYSCRLFYGNGTAKLVKDSFWRDYNRGVINDLGSHLLDTYFYWFGYKNSNFKIISKFKHENNSSDHAILNLATKEKLVQLEMTLCMWKNYFSCDILAENGSAHITSLSKWSKAQFIYRKRKIPSGVPEEKIYETPKGDNTWKLEHASFKKNVKLFKENNLKRDKIIFQSLNLK